jgi:hypothetical protein
MDRQADMVKLRRAFLQIMVANALSQQITKKVTALLT